MLPTLLKVLVRCPFLLGFGLCLPSIPQAVTPALEVVSIKEETPFHVRVRPLADLISKGEGDYNAVNRGWAGDTPGGIQRLTGKTFDQFTVGQVMDMQRRWLYAVGRYQFIPRTMRFAVANSDVTRQDMFTSDTQDRLFATLLEHKRPVIGQYLQGAPVPLWRALDAVAREWASVEYRSGRSYYRGVGGNRAHITRSEVKNVLTSIRNSI
ncbi:hypothetical protein [Synechococcus phage S-B68]|nr:hypothetical protein [Synechococcus phage S-B68]